MYHRDERVLRASHNLERKGTTMTHFDLYDQEDNEFAIDYRQSKPKGTAKQRSERQTFGRRRGKTPQQFNGIHRRRKKKIRW